MDLSYHTTPNKEKLMVLHFIDETSKYHTAKLIRECKVNNYSDLGICDAPDLGNLIVGNIHATSILLPCR